MFDAFEKNASLSKSTFDRKEQVLREALLEAQNALKFSKRSVVVLVNGVDGAGKGEVVNTLLEWLDPRFVTSLAFSAPSSEEREHPRWWRFWRVLPPHGRIGVLFGSWISDVIVDRVNRRLDRPGLERELRHISATEQALADEGTVLVKLWFHLSKKQQREKFRDWRDDKETRWRVTPHDLRNHKRYDRFRKISAHVVETTSTPAASWRIIEGFDVRHAKVRAGELLLAGLRQAIKPEPTRSAKAVAVSRKPHVSILNEVDLSATVDEEQYDERLPLLQGNINRAVRGLKREGRSAVLVFEGWDAAGKGGAIRRLTAALDSRDYTVVPVAAPSDEERRQHYLWRFWRHMPRDGHLTIFDRSWYGRVLVERVEGFASETQWRRAYEEINNMEAQLRQHGTVLAKLWLHISKDEQLRRFKERAATAHKAFKIGPEDYRNRSRWDGYEAAVDEMVARTSTSEAPWHLVAGNNKFHTRLDVLSHIISRIKD